MRSDQVTGRTRKTANPMTVSGKITENSLTKVEIETDSGPRSFDSALVERVVFGDVPPAYVEGQRYFDRGDYENSAAKYRLAAGDASARDVVKASARLLAAEALMSQGAMDSGACTRSAAEAGLFLADHPTNREVPRARMIQARATHLSGDPASAAELYRALFREAEGETPTTGYSVYGCSLAGLRGMHAYLASGDVQRSKELNNALDNTLVRVLGNMEEDDKKRNLVLAIQSEARLGEGWRLLAEGRASQARSFFSGQLANVPNTNGGPGSPALRDAARLGLAQAHLAGGQVRKAQITFAIVSAVGYASRDHWAEAQVGLADCVLRLNDPDARGQARTWLENVINVYGDTPAVLAAREKLATL
ncbi:MAG: hypothetical protein O7B99_09840 [Planctomycetota bacterium]|nr:hypothetical protein [Planctomycetota bacterium]